MNKVLLPPEQLKRLLATINPVADYYRESQAAIEGRSSGRRSEEAREYARLRRQTDVVFEEIYQENKI